MVSPTNQSSNVSTIRRSCRRRSLADITRSSSTSSCCIWLMAALFVSIIAFEQQYVNALNAPFRPKVSPKTSPKPQQLQQQQSLMRYANSAVEEGTTPEVRPSSFQQRMKNLLVKQDQAAAANKKKVLALQQQRQQQQTSSSATITPLIQEISTLEEFKDVVTQQDKKVCVRFYAPWCKACQAVTPGYMALAKKYSSDIHFVQVAITDDNINLHQGLGVPSIPFVHLYYPNGGGLVEERKFTRKELKSFQRILHDHVSGSCSLLQRRSIGTTDEQQQNEIIWSTLNPYEAYVA